MYALSWTIFVKKIAASGQEIFSDSLVYGMVRCLCSYTWANLVGWYTSRNASFSCLAFNSFIMFGAQYGVMQSSEYCTAGLAMVWRHKEGVG